jgi:hypothetical protein
MASGSMNNPLNKRRREEEHETRKRELEIQILEQKLAHVPFDCGLVVNLAPTR